MTAKKILFVCVHNSGRSQMAEAFFNRLAGGEAIATSAGTRPAKQINSTVADVMREAGIDTKDWKPKPLTPGMLASANRIISMGCNIAEACPARSITTEDWEIDDPDGKPIPEVRRIRDPIKARVIELIEELQ